MKLSSVFKDKEAIPSEYTCDGEDKAPMLKVEGVPSNTKSLALIMDDPDAPIGTFVHWVLWNIPIEGGEIRGGVKGINGFGRLGYGGPCPPSGTHRYFFKIYALDSKLTLQEGANKKELEAAMEGHIIEQGVLMGVYSKGKKN